MGSLFDRKYSQWGNMVLIKTEAYLGPSCKSTMELFRKNSERLKAVNYFCKNLHRRCSTGF